MIVVTGGAGMIGSNLIAALNRRGRTDILLVDELSDVRKLRNIADLHIADFDDKDAFVERFAGLGNIEAVFHLGACTRTTETDGRFMMRVNYLYSREILDICLQKRIPLVYASSAAVYGGSGDFRETPEFEHPLNVYAYSKLLFDRHVAQRVGPDAPPVAGLRYFNVYGPREHHKDDMASVAFHFHKQILGGGNPRLFGAHDGYAAGEQRRDFVHVEDVAAATLWCWDAGARGVFNCGTGEAGTFRAVAETVIGCHGTGEIEFIDFPDHLKGAYQSHTRADLTRLREAGYEGGFRNVETGVRDYVEWLKGGACLIVGPAWVGDMVMAQSLARALKDDRPERSIDVMAPAWTLPVIRRMPEVRAAIEVSIGHGELSLGERWRQGRALRGRYDHAFVLPNSLKSALTPWFARIARRTGYLGEQRYGLINDIRPLPAALKRRTAAKFRALAGEGAFTRPGLAVDLANQQTLCERWSLTPGGFVALAPGAEFGPSKRWPADRFAALARHFEKDGLRVLVLGSPRDAPVGEEVVAGTASALNLCGKTGLDDAVDLIAAARLAVTNDSGLMHIAAAVSVPTVAIFGSSSAADTPPLSPYAITVSAGLSCAPCFSRTCPLGHTDCMNTLDVNRVLDACEQALRRLESGNTQV